MACMPAQRARCCATVRTADRYSTVFGWRLLAADPLPSGSRTPLSYAACLLHAGSKYALPKLVNGITRSLFLEDAPALLQASAPRSQRLAPSAAGGLPGTLTAVTPPRGPWPAACICCSSHLPLYLPPVAGFAGLR